MTINLKDDKYYFYSTGDRSVGIPSLEETFKLRSDIVQFAKKTAIEYFNDKQAGDKIVNMEDAIDFLLSYEGGVIGVLPICEKHNAKYFPTGPCPDCEFEAMGGDEVFGG